MERRYIPCQHSQPMWDQSALITTLNSMSVQQQPSSNGDWFMDASTSTHMSSGSGKFSSTSPLASSSHIIVCNGSTLSITHFGSSIPTPSSPRLLNNILIAPTVIKNLISVHSFTRDNSISIEFDPFGFFVKDLCTKAEILCCDTMAISTRCLLIN